MFNWNPIYIYIKGISWIIYRLSSKMILYGHNNQDKLKSEIDSIGQLLQIDIYILTII